MSRILLDTHLLLWAVAEPRKLPPGARKRIEEADVFVSAASLWEVSIKASIGCSWPRRRRSPSCS